MKGLHEAGVIDKKTMRDFDKSRLTGIEPLDGEAIKAIREREALTPCKLTFTGGLRAAGLPV